MDAYFQQGNVTIYHGDSREFIEALGRVDLVLTDPPYRQGSTNRSEWKVTASVGGALWLAAKAVRNGGAMFVFSTTSGRGIDFALGAVGSALPFNRLLIWRKLFVRSQVAGPWRWDAVAILAFGRASFGRPMHSSVFTSPGPSSVPDLHARRHPAELPEGIARWLYDPFAGGSGIVLDPFCGTGSLLLPAAREGRPVIGIDISEQWCEEAAKRLSNPQLQLAV